MDNTKLVIANTAMTGFKYHTANASLQVRLVYTQYTSKCEINVRWIKDIRMIC